MKTLSLWQYSTAAVITATLLTLSYLFLPSTFPCILPVILFFGITGYVFGQRFFTDWQYRFDIGMITTLLLFPILITPVYWIFGYAQWYPLAASITILILAGISLYGQVIPKPIINIKKITEWRPAWKTCLYATPLFLLLLLIGTLIQKMTGDTIISPWTRIGPKFWFLLFVSIPTVYYALKQSTSAIYRYTILSLWYLLVYGFLLLTHKYAFGFDQHIHQASMDWIVNHGLLTPKVPYYLGQYFTVIPLAEITNLSLDWISRMLVPVSASLLLPLVLLQKKDLSPTIALLPIIPLSFLTFTTPNNLALLISLIAILAVWVGREDNSTKLFISFLTLWALITHVLIGLPLLCTLLLIYSKQRWQSILATLGIIFAVPLLLALYGGASSIVFEPHVFLNLFSQPHWYIGETDNLFVNVIYTYKALLWPILILVGLYGLYKNKTNQVLTRLAVTILATGAMVFLIASMLRFPDLISYEQSAYAGRLLAFMIVLGVPLLLLGLKEMIQKKRTISLLIPLLLISLYFLYPTRDAISFYTGVSIRDADMEAVSFIEQHAGSEPYIVLSNQTIGAAALSQFGFERYRFVPSGSEEYLYSIPTGGPLYQYFREYIYEGYERSAIEDAMEFTGVERAYLVHTNYWAPAGEIRDVSKEVADEWWEFGNMETWVYSFER